MKANNSLQCIYDVPEPNPNYPCIVILFLGRPEDEPDLGERGVKKP
jgi:hypothetical protein